MIAAEFAAAVAAKLGRTNQQTDVAPADGVSTAPPPEPLVMASADNQGVVPQPAQATSPPSSNLPNVHQQPQTSVQTPPQAPQQQQQQQPSPATGAIQTQQQQQTVSLSNGDTSNVTSVPTTTDNVNLKSEKDSSVLNSGDKTVADVVTNPQPSPVVEPVTVSVKSTLERTSVSATDSSALRETTPEVNIVPPTPVDKTSPESLTDTKTEAPSKTAEPAPETTGT